MSIRNCRVIVIFIMFSIFASVLARSVKTQDMSSSTENVKPPWQSQLMLWPKREGEAKPWRNDPRMKGRFAKGYPDDIQVLFVNPAGSSPDKPDKNEIMWVTIIEHDPKSDLFLGILINEPYYLQDVANQDNVVFHISPTSKYPVAVNRGQGHRAAAQPETKSPKFLEKVMAGVRAYRQGNFGHNMPGVERCIEILSPAVHGIPATVNAEEHFILHFVLARCLAEKYETKEAIEQFKAAIAINPDDVHAQMGLLAEISLKVHWPAGKPEPKDQAIWDQAFLEQLDLIRTRFSSDEAVQATIHAIFDESRAQDLSKLSKSELERQRKFGFGIFRWKVR
jgi:hypothetical protein